MEHSSSNLVTEPTIHGSSDLPSPRAVASICHQNDSVSQHLVTAEIHPIPNTPSDPLLSKISWSDDFSTYQARLETNSAEQYQDAGNDVVTELF